MPSVRFPLALLFGWSVLGADKPVPRVAPGYSAASIVNAADNQSDILAPNTIGTIYGTNLNYDGISQESSVFVNHFAAYLYYVSPGQINFLVPPNLLSGPALVYVVVNSVYGAMIHLTLAKAAPGLFQLYLPNADLPYVVATLADGSVLTPTSPAKPEDVVELWATGLGETTPPAIYGQLPTTAAPLVAGANLSVLLDGTPVKASAIEYAGVAPGFAGLYQINLKLPGSTGQNPEIRLQLDGASSISGVHLAVGP